MSRHLLRRADTQGLEIRFLSEISSGTNRREGGARSVGPSTVEALRLLSVSHRSAAFHELERFALSPEGRATLRRRLAGRGIDSVLLCTCNRTELYWLSHDATTDQEVEESLSAVAQPGSPLDPRLLRTTTGARVGVHLFRVAAGLESLVVGEGEILGQVREAIEIAQREGGVGPSLVHLFRSAIRFGGLARHRTGIGDGTLSVASAAVQLLERVHPGLNACQVVVVGAGRIGIKVARLLVAQRSARVVLMNRTVEHARQAAADLPVELASLDHLGERLAEADAVITAVRVGNPLITRELLEAAFRRRTRGRLALLDLSLPRAIAPDCGALPGVVLRDLSGFEQVAAANRERREREIATVEALLAREIPLFEGRMRELRARPLVAAIRHRAEQIRRQELERALEHGAEADRAALDRVTRRLVDRLLDVPSRALRGGGLSLDSTHTAYLETLFGLARPDEFDHATD